MPLLGGAAVSTRHLTVIGESPAPSADAGTEPMPGCGCASGETWAEAIGTTIMAAGRSWGGPTADPCSDHHAIGKTRTSAGTIDDTLTASLRHLTSQRPGRSKGQLQTDILAICPLRCPSESRTRVSGHCKSYNNYVYHLRKSTLQPFLCAEVEPPSHPYSKILGR